MHSETLAITNVSEHDIEYKIIQKYFHCEIEDVQNFSCYWNDFFPLKSKLYFWALGGT